MDAQVTNIVEQTVMERMRTKESFTALDISNALKADRYPVRHGPVAATVRDIYQSGAMGYYDYDRKLIDVVTDGGAKKTQAFLYLHGETREREYTARAQASLPLVAPDQARDMSGCVATSPLPLLPQPATRQRRTTAAHRGCKRRDGALAVPRALVERLGWAEGTTLALVSDGGQMRIAPRPPTLGTSEKTLRVWGGQRVRICKTKLQLGAVTAERVILVVEGSILKVEVKEITG